jgi:alkylated DNA repair dioxygenase AlkB
MNHVYNPAGVCIYCGEDARSAGQRCSVSLPAPAKSPKPVVRVYLDVTTVQHIVADFPVIVEIFRAGIGKISWHLDGSENPEIR